VEDEKDMKMTFEQAVAEVKKEREHQDNKWGSIEAGRNQSIPGFLIVLEAELNEAKAGWMKNVQGRDSCLAEIKQVAAVAIACLQTHGVEGN
jgi:hypothetical protein